MPSRELTNPTLGKENHLQKCLGKGYVSSQEGIYLYIHMLQELEFVSDGLGVTAKLPPRVLDIHRYGPSRAVWGQRDFFCAVISKVSNCGICVVANSTPSEW